MYSSNLASEFHQWEDFHLNDKCNMITLLHDCTFDCRDQSKDLPEETKDWSQAVEDAENQDPK